jgi:hypothetical protein
MLPLPGATSTGNLTLLRVAHATSLWLDFGAALWREGFLFFIESRFTPVRTKKNPFGRGARSEVETSSDLSWASERFEQIVAEHCEDATPVYSYVRPASLDDGTLAQAVLVGIERVDDHLTMAELVRQIYPAATGAAREQILDFVGRAPLTWGCWAGWKWLYKQAEAANDIELLAAAIARLRASPTWLRPDSLPLVPFVDRYPSPRTMRYLLRRMERYERTLAKTDPDAGDHLRRALEPYAPMAPNVVKAPRSSDESPPATLAPVPSPEADTVAARYWSSSLAECAAFATATLDQAEMDLAGALSSIEEIIRREQAVPRDPLLPNRRALMIDLLGQILDSSMTEPRRITVAGCIWKVGDAALSMQACAVLMRAPNEDLPAWTTALRVASPPELEAILEDVETRIRFTVWDAADVRLLAALMMSFAATDLLDRVVAVAPDAFHSPGMELSALFDSPDPEVAGWARERVLDVGLPGTVLLRLVESNWIADVAMLSGAVGLLRSDDPDLVACMRRLLADERPRVRRMGIALARRHQDTLPVQLAIQALAAARERDAWMLALDLVAREPERVADAPGLVVRALLERWMTPHQRSAITRQIEAAPRAYQDVLLAVARRGQPRQREWALRLLIDLSHQGVATPGFELVPLAEVGQ